MNTTNALLALLITTTGANTILSAKDTTPPPIEQTQSLQDTQLQKAHTYIHTHCKQYVHMVNHRQDPPLNLRFRNIAKQLFPNDRRAQQHYNFHTPKRCNELLDALPHLFIQ